MAKRRPVRTASPLPTAGKPARDDAPRDRHLADVATLGLLFFATLAAYWPALHGAAVWDDGGHITRPDLQSLHGLWRIWFDLGATQQYYPLLHSAFWIEHRLWGDAVLGYHLVNVCLHALAAALVVFLVRRLSLPGAWLAGFVFALHPMQVEAVAWISEQKSTLSAVFYLAAALTYLKWDRERRKSTYLLALFLFVLALLSKTVTATLPAVLLGIVWWQRGRLSWKRDGLPLLPWFAIGIPAGLFTAWVERTFIGAAGSEFALTFMQRFLLAGRVIWFYAGKLVWPFNLAFSYPRWRIDPSAWWQYLYPAGVLAVGITLLLAARRNRGPLAAFLIFVVTLFPVLGFLNVLPFRYSWVADHFQYLASLALTVPLTSALTVAVARYLANQATRVAILTSLVVVLAIASSRQSNMYRDTETLYRETMARNPDSFLAHNNLGSILVLLPGRVPEAVAEFEAAIRIEPAYPEAHYNLGNAWEQTQPPGPSPDIVREYETAIRFKPDYPEAHNNLGNALARIPGRLPDAIAEYQLALRGRPDLAQTHANLGKALTHTPGRLLDGIAEYETAVRMNPDAAELHYNLGTALARVPRLSDAIAELQAAVRIGPDLVEAHFNLATLLAQAPGRMPDAIAEFAATLRLRPDFEPARQALEHRQAGSK
jgi:tetratricopeptide (TPR) repeat protein